MIFLASVTLSVFTSLCAFVPNTLGLPEHLQQDSCPACGEGTYDYERTKPYWGLRAFSNMDYPYGLLEELFGGVLSTVVIRENHCNSTNSQSEACMRDSIVRYCHYNLSQMNALHAEMQTPNSTCPYTTLPAFSDTPEMVQIDRKLLHFESEQNQYENIKRHIHIYKTAKQFIDGCFNGNNTLNIGGLRFCSFTKYMDLYRNIILLHNEITSDFDKKDALTVYQKLFCQKIWKETKEQNNNTIQPFLISHPFCPNPCSVRLGRCSNTSHTMALHRSPSIIPSISESNCFPWGLYSHEYDCLCEPGYSWDPNSKTCYAPDICAQNAMEVKRKGLPESALLCSPKGTLKCVSDPLQSTSGPDTEELYLLHSQLHSRYKCICRNAFMGVRCDRPRDACVESGIAGGIPGEQACRTYLGNKCTSHNGTDFYFCKCTENWNHELALSFPNCYKRRSICERVICRNRGTCVSSNDQKAFICLCEYGWRGPLCEFPDVRHWLPWGAWTLCSAPLCTGRGWQSRTRECRVPVNRSEDAGTCVGNTVEFRPCRSGCPNPVDSYVPMIKLILYFGFCLLALQACTTIIFMILKMEYA